MNVALWAEIRRLSEIEKLSQRPSPNGCIAVAGP